MVKEKLTIDPNFREPESPEVLLGESGFAPTDPGAGEFLHAVERWARERKDEPSRFTSDIPPISAKGPGRAPLHDPAIYDPDTQEPYSQTAREL